MKKMIITLFCLMCFSQTFASSSMTSACPKAAATQNADFCSTFITSAQCHCKENRIPKICDDVNKLYDYLLSIFGSIKTACQFQHDVPVQECIDDWNCFRSGGKDAHGNLCSGTGQSCQ